MAINILRIDDRLIHGQVVEGWLRSVQVSVLVIVSDRLTDKEEEKILFSLAVQGRMSVDCINIAEAAKRFSGDYYKKSQVMVLVESPKEVLELLQKGLKIESINVGGLHFSPGKTAINDSLYVNDEDCEIFEKIAAFNVVIEGRTLPNDKRLDVLSEIKKLKKKS
jgi:mannose/fructose/N-acetylgalactosamine-specific phosphotransferase system component IIB